MEKLNTIVYGLVSLVVIVLLVATVALPIIEDSRYDLQTVEQNSDYRYELIESTDTMVIKITGGKPTINGENVTWGDNMPSGSTTKFFIYSDIAVISINYVKDTDTWSTTWAAFFDIANDDDRAVASLDATTSATFSNGTLTITRATPGSEFSYTSPYSWVLCPNDTGDYVAYPISDLSTKSVYVDNTSEIYLSGTTAQSGWLAHGTLNNIEVDFNVYSGAVSTPGSITVTYEDAFYGATCKVLSVSKTGSMATIDYIFVPIDYHALTQNNSVISVLLSILPLLLMIVPVMIVARLVVNGRD